MFSRSTDNLTPWLIGAVTGASSSLFWPTLPSAGWGVLALCLSGLWWWTGRYILADHGLAAGRAFPSGCLAGAGWALIFFRLQLGWIATLPIDESHHNIAGRVLESRQSDYGVQIVLQVRQWRDSALWPAPRARLYLSGEPPAVGSWLQGEARLRPLRGTANPAGFALESWALGQGITASGSVRQWQATPPVVYDRWRDTWLAKARPLLADLPQGGLLAALIFGERDGVDSARWSQFRETGIIHLLAISGLHIGLAAACGWWCGRVLTLPWPHLGNRLPVLLAISLSGLYAALSGWGVPAVRAWIMILLWLLLRRLHRRWSRWQVWWWVLALMLLGSPWLLFNSGFWLSFFAVGLLAVAPLVLRRLNLLTLQLWLLYGMLPLQCLLFSGISLLALPVNLLAVPLFSLLLIPLGLVSGLLVPWAPSWAAFGFGWADWGLGLFLQGLDTLTAAFSGWWTVSDDMQFLLLGLWLLPWLWWGPATRLLALLVALALLLHRLQPAPRWEVQVLDVGQGLSVLVRQQKRALLYDVGDRFPSGDSLAKRVVWPTLQAAGVRELDYLVVSHQDRDHAGDWAWLIEQLPVQQLLSSAPLRPDVTPCRPARQWRWEALTLSLLAAPAWPLTTRGENADSCVLHITDGQYSVLLPGDLPREQEQQLVQAGQLSPVTLLLSAHHGSATSSSASLIAKTRPEWVVHSTGYRNRWRFPRPEVVARFALRGSQQLNTAETGALRFSVMNKGWQVEAYRQSGPWYRRLPSALAAAPPLG